VKTVVVCLPSTEGVVLRDFGESSRFFDAHHISALVGWRPEAQTRSRRPPRRWLKWDASYGIFRNG
jgi:hypothetical protein